MEETSEQRKLFVGGISWETTEDVLRDHFNKYGNVVGCVIAKDKITGSPRGFAFVSFLEPSAVEQALHDSHQILSRTVEVKKAISRSEQQQSQQQQSWGLDRNSRVNGRDNEYFRTKKIFVGGLSANLTDNEFKDYFERFGRITDVVVMHDNLTKRPRGFGFITFQSEDSVEEVMQKNFHELSGKLVEVKRAIPKEGNISNINVYSARLGGGGGGYYYSSYQHGNCPSYNSQYGLLPSYGPLASYGGVTGYPYRAGIFGGSYPSGGFGGIGYGLASVAPRSLWNSPAVVANHSSTMPYGIASSMYPAYVNGGVELVGIGANAYNGTTGAGMNGTVDAQGTADSTTYQIGRENVNANLLGSSGSFHGAASKQNKKVTNQRVKSYPAGKSS